MPSSVPTSDLVRRQFGAVADAYATSTYHASGADLAALVQAAGLSGTEHVLDLGCGAGHASLALAAHAAERHRGGRHPRHGRYGQPARHAARRRQPHRARGRRGGPAFPGRALRRGDQSRCRAPLRRPPPGAGRSVPRAAPPGPTAGDRLRCPGDCRPRHVHELLRAPAGCVARAQLAPLRMAGDARRRRFSPAGGSRALRHSAGRPGLGGAHAHARPSRWTPSAACSPKPRRGQREAFDLRVADPWGFNVTLALFQATKP